MQCAMDEGSSVLMHAPQTFQQMMNTITQDMRSEA